MKYHIDVDPEDTQSSHGITLSLIGSGKRVLDVGCATGYLSAAIKEQGNTVTGVELDPSAGEAARPHLEQLVIGDLEAMDLTAELGEHRFDAILFADVLEHLVNPLRVLRQTPALLAPGGSVVISIPNIAHGAMRLALLQGRFEYRELGLLDDTHLRFFTRSSLDDLVRLAGLVTVEQRRAVLGYYDTEIPVRPEDFPPDVVEVLDRDPDSLTYQFVIRCVASDRPAGDDVSAELLARNDEIADLRRQLAQVTVSAPRTQPPTLGVVGPASAHPFDELRRMVVAHEVGRRLRPWDVRWLDWQGGEARPAPDGVPVTPVTTSGDPAGRTASHLDCAILAGTWSPGAADAAVTSISDEGCPVHLAAVGGLDADHLPHLRRPGAIAAWGPDDRVATVPDPLLLADRLVGPGILAHRASLLAATGTLPAPQAGYVLVSVAGGEAGALARAVDGLAQHDELAVAVVPDGHDDGSTFAKAVAAGASRATLATEPLDPIDLLAAVATARFVVTDQPAILWLAVALQRPCVGLAPADDDQDGPAMACARRWLADPDLVVATPGAIASGLVAARVRASSDAWSLPAIDELDLWLDDLCGAVAATGARRLAASWPAQLAEARHRADVANRVNDGLRHRLMKQRTGFGAIARRIVAGGDASVSVAEHRILADKLARAEAEVARMQEEVATLALHIQATDATLTMRTLAPARRIYGRLRNL